MRLGVRIEQGTHETDDPKNSRRSRYGLHSHPIKSAQDAVSAPTVQEFVSLGTAEET